MKHLIGDIFNYMDQGMFDVVLHGCNCYCNMGAGIASEFKKRYPDVYNTDLRTRKGDRTKLGNYSTTTIYTPTGYHIIIVNAYTQYNFGRYSPPFENGRQSDYDAIRGVFQKVNIEFNHLKIGYPLIGAGLAKGDWRIISQIIDQELQNQDHVLVTLN